MYILNGLIGAVVSGTLAYITYRLDEKAIDKGNYVKTWGNGKLTLWSFPFYCSMIFLAVFVVALFGGMG